MCDELASEGTCYVNDQRVCFARVSQPEPIPAYTSGSSTRLFEERQSSVITSDSEGQTNNPGI